MRPAAETRAFPIAGYDEMNVEELRLVRDHKEPNKRRETFLEQVDRSIGHPNHPREVELP